MCNGALLEKEIVIFPIFSLNRTENRVEWDAFTDDE